MGSFPLFILLGDIVIGMTDGYESIYLLLFLYLRIIYVLYGTFQASELATYVCTCNIL